MKIALAIFLFAHSTAHFAGFVVFWRNVHRNLHNRYRRVFLGKDTEFEKFGFRFMAVLYLISALAFCYFGIELLTGIHLFWDNIWRVTIISLVMCVVGWPKAKLGVIANAILILFLIINNYYYWVN